MVQALIRSIPGRLFQVSNAVAKGRVCSSMRLAEFRDLFREFIPMRQPLLQNESTMFVQASGGSLLQHGILPRSRLRARRAKPLDRIPHAPWRAA
jgi:hypothetical protein